MSKEKVLIVDDDKDVVKGLGIRLKAHGYQVSVANDAISAVSVARKVEPDLILLDLGLPGGDGFKVMERLESLPATISTPIIVVTARDSLGTQKRAVHAGAAAFLQKPVDNDKLLLSIRQALGEGVVT